MSKILSFGPNYSLNFKTFHFLNWGGYGSVYGCKEGYAIKVFTNFMNRNRHRSEVGFGMIASKFYPDLFVKHYGLLKDEYVFLEKCEYDLLEYAYEEIVPLFEKDYE